MPHVAWSHAYIDNQGKGTSMLKLIVGAMRELLEISALIIIVMCVYYAYRYASLAGYGPLGEAFLSVVGFLIGLVVCVAVLGIPALLLRINANLERLNVTSGKVLATLKSQDTRAGEESPLVAGFPNQGRPSKSKEA